MLRLIALVLVSLALAACGGDNGDDGNGAADDGNGTAATETAAGDGDANSVQIEMSPQGEFEQNGRATLTELSDGTTQVAVELFDGPDNRQPAHIHDGSCAELGGVAYPLNDLEEGRSTTQVDVALDELTSGEYAINAHLSADQIDQYTACGDITSEGS